MRVDRLDLPAYGHYEDAVIDLSRPDHGLTVVYGLNEAGKSTARRALLAALFGVERGNPDTHRVGPHGLRVGACLRAADGGIVSFTRIGLSRTERDDGSSLDPEALSRFLGGFGRELYTRVFAMDHDELRSGSESLLDADGEIGRLLFGASLGSGSVAAVLRRLDERAAVLYRERGRTQLIPKALDAYRAGMQQARTARVRARDWERLRRDEQDAHEELVKVRGTFERVRAEQVRLNRIRAARPLLARRHDAAQRLHALDAVPSAHWAEEASNALSRFREARSDDERAAAEQVRLATQVAAIDVPEAVLARAGRIEELTEGIGRYKKNVEDLPKRRTDLESAQRAVSEQLRRLGKAADDGTIVAESNLVTVEELARRHVELAADERAATSEVRKADQRVDEARASLAGLPQALDVASLERVARLARQKLEVVRTLTTDRAEHAAAAADLAARAGRLGLGMLRREEIEALRVPAMADVDTERQRRHAHRLELAQIEGRLEKIASILQTMDKEIEAAATTSPDPGRLRIARDDRDAGWRVVRDVVEGVPVDTRWAGDLPLADAFEAALAEADGAADERYEYADVIATISQLRTRKATTEEERRMLEERRRALVHDDTAAAAAWGARWSRVGVAAGPPDAMAGWLSDERELVAAIGRWHLQEAKLGASDADIARHAAAVAAAVAAVGREPCSDQLELLLAQADDIVAAAKDVADERRRVASELQRAEREQPQRHAALLEHRGALEQWRRSWDAALRPLWLTPSTSTTAAQVAVSAHRALAAARAEAASLRRRIDGIDADCRDYVTQVTATAAQLIRGTDERTPLATVSELQCRLNDARAAQQRRETLESQLSQASAAAQEAAAALDGARRELVTLRLEIALDPAEETPGAGIEEVIGRAREAASLRQKLEEIDNDLLGQGDGRSVEEVEAESAVVGDTLDGELDTVTAEVAQLQDQLEEANTRLADARRAVQGVTDATTAADLEQEAEAELALASELATEYARTALAAEVLRTTIADYGERHRGPLLRRAAEVFRELTGGAFTDLVADIDGERHVLLATRVSGELCAAGCLSDGTRDQLYLALRLAGLEHQLAAAADPPPVVLDDVLIHFDDTRAAAAVRALGELGAFAQVLLFTHHERVVEIAQRELAPDALAVVRLDPRRHDQRPPAGTGIVAGRAGRQRPGDGDATVEARILAAVRAADGRALGKAQLVERSGIHDGEWPAAIRTLVGRGALVQEGERRGARYRLAE